MSGSLSPTRKSYQSILPKYAVESSEFYIPENLLRIDVLSRDREISLYSSVDEGSRNSYISICYDELTRGFTLVSNAPHFPKTIEGVVYQPVPSTNVKFPDIDDISDNSIAVDNNGHSRILHHFDPSNRVWTSTFRFIPSESKYLLGRANLLHDFNILTKISKIKIPDAFEPLFGSAALFVIGSDHCTRVSESFYFDMTPKSIRNRCKEVYNVEEASSANSSSTNSSEVSNVDPVTALNMCCFNLPKEFKVNDLYLVIQVTKVLTGDSEKSISTYLKAHSESSLDENWKRLNSYRQNIGLGAIKVTENRIVGGMDIRCSIFANKQAINDAMIGQAIRDNFSKLEYLNMDVVFNIAEVSDIQNCEMLPEGFLPPDTEEDIVEVSSHVIGRTIQDDTCNWRCSDAKDPFGNMTTRGVRLINFLKPSNAGDRRHIKYSLDHTLYLYPTAFEKFEQRNLAMKVELVEFVDIVSGGEPAESDTHYILSNIYNNKLGPLFCTALYSTVNYHNKSPVLSDEFKIKLPDVVNSKHYLKFTMYHVHVKPPANRQKFNIFSNGSDTSMSETSVNLGVGFLSLLRIDSVHGCLLPDKEHQVKIACRETVLSPGSSSSMLASRSGRSDSVSTVKTTSSHSSGSPFIRISTKAVSNFISTCPCTQAVLNAQPRPLGALPSSILPIDCLKHIMTMQPPSLTDLVTAIKGLRRASSQEIINHFLVLFRILCRSMCGGNGEMNKTFSNPFNHSQTRCHAFVMMLQLFSSIAPQVTSTATGGGEEVQTDEGLLNAFIDNLFDEEVPMLEIESDRISKTSASISANRKSATSEYCVSTESISVSLDGMDLADDKLFDVSSNNYDKSTKKDESTRGVSTMDKRNSSGSPVTIETIDSERISTYGSFFMGSSFYDNETNFKSQNKLRYSHDMLQLTSFVDNPDHLNIAWNDKQQYTNYLANQFAEQVLRIIIEDEISRVVTAISKDVSDSLTKILEKKLKPKNTQVLLAQYMYPWWTNQLVTGADDTRDRLPYDQESFWYNNHHNKIPYLVDSSQTTAAVSSNNVSTVDDMSAVIKVRAPHRYYDSVPGYEDRKVNDHGTSTAASGGADKHWWPWAYEVIIHQWVCLFNLIQGNEQMVIKDSTCTGAYPLNAEVIPVDSVRVLLLDHGPALLKMILKSLIMRIVREKKSAPVAVDSQLISVLDRLLSLISKESTMKTTSLFRARRLTIAVSQFLRSLLALIIPSQICRLVSSYFESLIEGSSYRKSDQIELRLLVLQELVSFDYQVALNFSSPSDEPLSLRRQRETATHRRWQTSSESALILNESVRAILNQNSLNDPPSHWFADLFLSECFNGYRQVEIKIQEKSLKLLHEALVRQSFDARFQSLQSRQRIAILYLPILREIIKETHKLAVKPFDSFERRELLPLMLYLLEDVPSHVLREEIRQFCYQTYIPVADPNNQINEMTGTATSGTGLTSRPQSMNIHQSKRSVGGSPIQPKMSRKASMSIVSSSTLNIDDLQPVVLLLIILLNLTLDTFEYKLYQGGGVGVNSKLSQLEKNFHDRSLRKVGSAGNIQSSKAPVGQQRKWATAKDKKHQSIRLSQNPTNQVTPSIQLSALASLSHESTKLVTKTLIMILEECPCKRTVDKILDIEENSNDLVIKIVQFVLYTALHGLHCHQSQIGIKALYDVAKFAMKKFGLKMFMVCVGDTLQDWIRVTYTIICCSKGDKYVVENENLVASQSFLFYFLTGTFAYYGHFILLADTCKAVFADVIDTILESHSDDIKTLLDEDEVLLPLRDGLISIKTEAIKRLHSSNINNLAAKATCFLMDELIIIFDALKCVRHYIPNPVLYDWQGSNTLDGPLDEKLKFRMSRRNSAVISECYTNRKISLNVDIDEVIETFMKAAQVFDPVRLTRFNILWLSNIARIHEMNNNKSDGAELRWRIFHICVLVENNWSSAWYPRPPLDWEKGSSYLKHSLSHSVRKYGSQGELRESAPSSPITNNSTERNFLVTLIDVINLPRAKAWMNQKQYLDHLEITLLKSIELFTSSGLFYLTERSSLCLVDFYRKTGQIRKLGMEYERLSKSITTACDSGDIKSSFGLGTFYWVQFSGKGVPKTLIQKEFIYRNGNSVHVSEFHTLMQSLLKILVKNGVEVKISSQNTPSATDYQSDGAIVFIATVKPIFSKVTTTIPHALNHVKEFQYSAPFTKESSLRTHAKSMDAQWKRNTRLIVDEPFPYIQSRQRIVTKVSKELCPIEVAIEDIEDRIEAMKFELSDSSSLVLNNLMRLAQGSVLPQVNQGAGEVAKVFLGNANDVSESMQLSLKITLTEFLTYSKVILSECRKLMKLNDSNSGEDMYMELNASNRENGKKNFSLVDNQNIVWQSEMEKGFDKLVDIILPYIMDIPGSEALKKN